LWFLDVVASKKKLLYFFPNNFFFLIKFFNISFSSDINFFLIFKRIFFLKKYTPPSVRGEDFEKFTSFLEFILRQFNF